MLATSGAQQQAYLRKHEQNTDMKTIENVIKDVVLSSIRSGDGKIDAVKMEKARDVGFAFEEVQKLVQLAEKHGDANDIEAFLENVQIVPRDASENSFNHIVLPNIETGNREAKESLDEKEDEGKISAPRAIADAIESAVNSGSGEVDPEALQLAVDTGWTSDEVHNMARLALKSIHDHDGDKSRVLSDLRRLRTMKGQKRPQKEDSNSNTWTSGYKPKGSWTMSYKEHRALSKAVLTAIRSPSHDVDPVAMEEAIKEGVSREMVMEAIDSALNNIDAALEKKRLRLLKETEEKM